MSLQIFFCLNLRLTINAVATRLGNGKKKKETKINDISFYVTGVTCLSLNPQERTEPWAKEKTCDGGKTSLNGDRLMTDTISE